MKKKKKSPQRSPTEERWRLGLRSYSCNQWMILEAQLPHPHNRKKQKRLCALKGPSLLDVPLFSLFTLLCFKYSSALVIIALLLAPLFWVNCFFPPFCFPLLRPSSHPLPPLPPSLSLRGLSSGMRERGEWGRQALSWLSWEPLAPCVLGPVLPPLSINLQWQPHCLPNPPRILGDDRPAPLCSINLWPPTLRHQSQAWGSGVIPARATGRTPVWCPRRDSCHTDNLFTKMYLSWILKGGVTYSHTLFTFCLHGVYTGSEWEDKDVEMKFIRRLFITGGDLVSSQQCQVMQRVLNYAHTPIMWKRPALLEGVVRYFHWDQWNMMAASIFSQRMHDIYSLSGW